MLIYDFRAIGEKLYAYRKRAGKTQLEVATAAEIGERTYADIERGSTNTRLATLLSICNALHITPDAILTEENTSLTVREEELLTRLHACPPQNQETALRLLDVYLQSLRCKPESSEVQMPNEEP